MNIATPARQSSIQQPNRRFKTFLATLLAAAIATGTSLADSYTNTIPHGYSLIGNALQHGYNSLDELLPLPFFLEFFRANCDAQRQFRAFNDPDSGWVDPSTGMPSDETLAPGSGAIIYNSGPGFSWSFTGTPIVPVLPVALTCDCGKYYLLSRQTPGPGTFENVIGLQPAEGAQVLRLKPGREVTPLDDSNYSTYTFSNATWTPSVPALNTGEAAWFLVPCNQCITLQGASDFEAACGTSWSFTEPTAINTCCSGQVSVTVVSTITNLTSPRSITRTWRADDTCGNSVASHQTVTLPDSPEIHQLPQDVTAGVCETIRLSVGAVSQGPLTYQWFHENDLILGATDSILTVANVQAADAGAYSVEVVNACDTARVGPVTLSVIAPRAPTITAQPQSRTMAIGATGALVVQADFNGSLGYQWQLNGNPIAGATDSSLTLNNAQPPQAGTYTVTVTGCGGSVASAPATLTLVAPASISGSVFYDFNANGSRDTSGEYGLPEWIIRLDGDGGSRQVTTDANGKFRFDLLVPGNYTLSQEGLANQWQIGPSRWIQTSPTPGAIPVAAGQNGTVDFALKLPPYIPSIQWQQGLGGFGTDKITRLVPTADGGYLIGLASDTLRSGLATSPSFGGYDYWLVRLDAFGRQLWERSFGGDDDDALYGLKQTRDGGFIVVGSSSSGLSGNKTTAKRGWWILRLNSDGEALWQNSFDSVASYQIANDVVQMSDDGFLVCGYTLGGAGDKSEPNLGTYDGWVVRVDANGNKLWDKAYGGEGDDRLGCVSPAPNGRFLLAGSSSSAAGAHKSSPNYGDTDYWLICIEEDGTVVWERSFGGSNTEWLYSLIPTSDGGALLGGWSFSSVSGNRTNPHNAMQDAWCVRVAANGDKLWDRGYASTGNQIASALAQTPDGGFLIGCFSNGREGHDKLTPQFTNNYNNIDVWLLRTDANGNPVWDQTYGGSDQDTLSTLALTSDGGAILACNSRSSDGVNPNPNHGNTDGWIIKLSPLDCAAGSSPTLVSAEADCALQQIVAHFSAPLNPANALLPANYLFSGGSVQQASFLQNTMTVLLKTASLSPGVSYTLAVQNLAGECGNPLAPNSQVSVACQGQIRGSLFLDANENCVADANEFIVAGGTVELEPGAHFALSDQAGNFSLSVPAGSYTLRAVPNSRLSLTPSCPAGSVAYAVTVTDGQILPGHNFGVQGPHGQPCPNLFVDLAATYPGPKLVHIAGPNTPCCGADYYYDIYYENRGQTPVSGSWIELNLPPECTYVSSLSFPTLPPPCNCPNGAAGTPCPNGSGIVLGNGPCVHWDVGNIPIGASGNIMVKVHLDCDITTQCPSQPMLNTEVRIFPLAGDCDPNDNSSHHQVKPCCSWDPNDNQVFPKGCGPAGLIHRDQTLTYLVRFQNEGGAPASLVVVQNILDPEFDISTLEFLGASHPYTVEILGRELRWIFPNIMLPSAAVNEPASHGYLKFRVRARVDAPLGTILTNTAAIYFDANDAVVTITTTNTITDAPVPRAAFTVAPRPGFAGHVEDFQYTGGSTGAEFLWRFGPGAVPESSTEPNPFGVIFPADGSRLVSLEVKQGDCSETALATVTAGQPMLSITRNANGGILLWWQGAGYVLETSRELNAAAQWHRVGAAPTAFDDWFVVAPELIDSSAFYRLVQVP